jgi:hypothetical protein
MPQRFSESFAAEAVAAMNPSRRTDACDIKSGRLQETRAVRFTTPISNTMSSARVCLLVLITAYSQMSPDAINGRFDKVLSKSIMLHYAVPLN